VAAIIMALLVTSTVATIIPLGFSDSFSREVYLDGTLRVDGGNYAGLVTLNAGAEYELMLAGFPSDGSVSVYLNNTLVASGTALNSTGGVTTDITIPLLLTGDYFFRVIDNLSVEYAFKVNQLIVPYIVCTPDTGNVADAFTINGENFLDYVNSSVTIYFQNSADSPYYTLMWNNTITNSSWSVDLVVPQSCGGERNVDARTSNGAITITFDLYTVLPLIESCDSAGDQKDVFDLGETVFVVGSGCSLLSIYSLYVVEDVANWSDGMTIPTSLSNPNCTVQPTGEGTVTVTTVWSNPQIAGKYDIVVDVNGNGVYDKGIDILDDNDVEVTAGLVIPEFSAILILPLFIMITLFAVLVKFRKEEKLRATW
jgi:hypothetical protein